MCQHVIPLLVKTVECVPRFCQGLSLPSGEAAWDGIAAADTQLYLAGVSRNGGSSAKPSISEILLLRWVFSPASKRSWNIPYEVMSNSWTHGQDQAAVPKARKLMGRKSQSRTRKKRWRATPRRWAQELDVPTLTGYIYMYIHTHTYIYIDSWRWWWRYYYIYILLYISIFILYINNIYIYTHIK